MDIHFFHEIDHVEEIYLSDENEKIDRSRINKEESKCCVESKNFQEEAFEEFREVLIIKASETHHLEEHSYAKKMQVVSNTKESQLMTDEKLLPDEQVEDDFKKTAETENKDFTPEEGDFELTTDEKMPPEDSEVEDNIKKVRAIEAQMYYKVSLFKEHLLQTIIQKNNATSPEEDLLKSCLLNQQYQMIREMPLTDRIFFQDL